MTILCTFPGRYGDLLWALPTLRALAYAVNDPVDLLIAGEFASIMPLIQEQEYIGSVLADDHWSMGSTREENAPTVTAKYDHVIHLGYTTWPSVPLPFETLNNYNRYALDHTLPHITSARLRLEDPWIRRPDVPRLPTLWVCGFTEAYFELKLGVWHLLQEGHSWQPVATICTGPRWSKEAHHPGADWMQGARWLASAAVLLADCSAWHVLAVAMGVPVVVMEPMEARWNPIFYPLGMDGPQVTVVKGHDGRPTFDARHVADTLEETIRRSYGTTGRGALAWDDRAPAQG